MSKKVQLSDGFYKASMRGDFTRFIAVKNGRSVLSWRSETNRMADLYASIVTEFDFENIEPITAEEFWAEVEKVNEVFKNLLS